MKRTNSELTPEQEMELAKLAEMPDAEIDTEDIPELPNWQNAERGKFYRPVKQQITLRLDADLIAWFKSHSKGPNGRGYQTQINRALREYIEQHTTTN
ncbi:MAG: BrnA antitoxin family protein [Caldilineaceae bacterium]